MHQGSFSILFVLVVIAATMSPTNVLADEICSPPQSPGRLLGFEILDDPADGHYRVVWAGSTTVYEDLCGTTRYTLMESADEGRSWVTVDQQLHLPLTTYSWEVPPEGRSIGTYQYQMLVCNSAVLDGSELCVLSDSIVANVSGIPAPPIAVTVPWGISLDGTYSVRVVGGEEVGIKYRVYERTRPLGSSPADWGAWVQIYEGLSNEVLREALGEGLYDYAAATGNEHGWSEMQQSETQKTVVTTPSVSVQYSYDALGRLAYVTDTTAGDRDYRYDPAGNRTSLATNGEAHNQPPIATNDAITADVGTVVTRDLVSNDSDPNNANSELRIASTTPPVNASVELLADGRTVEIVGQTDGPSTFQYKLIDGLGGEDLATVSLTINEPAPPAKPTYPRITDINGCPPETGKDGDGNLTFRWSGNATKFFVRRNHSTGTQCSSAGANNYYPYSNLGTGWHDFKVRACNGGAVLKSGTAEPYHCTSTPEKCSGWTTVVVAGVDRNCSFGGNY